MDADKVTSPARIGAPECHLLRTAPGFARQTPAASDLLTSDLAPFYFTPSAPSRLFLLKPHRKGLTSAASPKSNRQAGRNLGVTQGPSQQACDCRPLLHPPLWHPPPLPPQAWLRPSQPLFWDKLLPQLPVPPPRVSPATGPSTPPRA